MSTDKFLARLCALVPPPGFHMTRYFGVFANRHHLRPRIIPPSALPTPGQQLALALADSANDKADDDTESSPRPRHLGWAKLLARVFAVDVTLCRKCGGRMRVLEVVELPTTLPASSTAPGRRPAPSSRPGLVIPRLNARSGVALDPACRATEELASGHPHRATRSRTRRPKSSEVALQLHQTACIHGPWPLRYSTRRQNSRLEPLKRENSRLELLKRRYRMCEDV